MCYFLLANDFLCDDHMDLFGLIKSRQQQKDH